MFPAARIHGTFLPMGIATARLVTAMKATLAPVPHATASLVTVTMAAEAITTNLVAVVDAMEALVLRREIS